MSRQDVARWGKESPSSGQLKDMKDMRRRGWRLLENQPRLVQTVGDLGEIEILAFLKNGEASVRGEEMMARGESLEANLSQADLETIVKICNENPDDSRVAAFRKSLGGLYLTAVKTVWSDSHSSRRVAFLRRLGGEWFVGFDWLDDGWGSRGRLGCLRK